MHVMHGFWLKTPKTPLIGPWKRSRFAMAIAQERLQRLDPLELGGGARFVAHRRAAGCEPGRGRSAQEGGCERTDGWRLGGGWVLEKNYVLLFFEWNRGLLWGLFWVCLCLGVVGLGGENWGVVRLNCQSQAFSGVSKHLRAMLASECFSAEWKHSKFVNILNIRPDQRIWINGVSGIMWNLYNELKLDNLCPNTPNRWFLVACSILLIATDFLKPLVLEEYWIDSPWTH